MLVGKDVCHTQDGFGSDVPAQGQRGSGSFERSAIEVWGDFQ
jgi:hypothetical protein